MLEIPLCTKVSRDVVQCPELSLVLYHKIKGNYKVCNFGLRESKHGGQRGGPEGAGSMSNPGECCRWRHQSCELGPRGGAKQAQKAKEEHSVRLHWPETEQFIHDNIFTLINSKGSLYQRKGSPSASLLGQHRSRPGRARARQEGQEVSEHQRQQQQSSQLWVPGLSSGRECCLPWLLHAGVRLGGLALAMQGTAFRGNQAFRQYTEFFLQATMLAGLAMLCVFSS